LMYAQSVYDAMCILGAVRYTLLVSQEMRRHLEENFRSVRKEQRNIYRQRLRRALLRDLMDLTLFAVTQPEDQVEQVLTPENLDLFLRAAAGDGCETISVRHFDIARKMLKLATRRLEVLIDPDYLRMVYPTVENVVWLLTKLKGKPLELPAEGHRNLFIGPVQGWRRPREQIERDRRVILQKLPLS